MKPLKPPKPVQPPQRQWRLKLQKKQPLDAALEQLRLSAEKALASPGVIVFQAAAVDKRKKYISS